MEFTSIGLEGLLNKEYSYVGKEKKVRDNNKFVVLKDNYGSVRIIRKGTNSEWIGALQVVTNDEVAIASNIFVDEQHRRKGVAGEIIKYAYKMFPNLTFTNNRNFMSVGMVKKYERV